jgi:hypothetical protein
MHACEALVPIDAPADKSLAVPDIALAPGRPQHLQVIGPDDRPVAGTRVSSLQHHRSIGGEPVAGSEFTFLHANPGQAETVVILQTDRSLAACVDLKGDEPDPVRVALQPAGTVTGRLVDEQGHPRPKVNLAILQHFKTRGDSTSRERFDPVSTGPDGRFRIKDLVPGLPYTLQVIKKNEMNYSLRAEGYLKTNQWTVKPGEVQDWGDVQVKTYRP